MSGFFSSIFVAIIFPFTFSTFLGLMVGVRGLDPLIVWDSFAWFPTFALAAHVYQGLNPPRGRILFLRRFHRERLPNFPISRVINRLANLGYETMTLADTAVPRGVEGRVFLLVLSLPIGWCIGMLFMVSYVMLGIGFMTAECLILLFPGLILFSIFTALRNKLQQYAIISFESDDFYFILIFSLLLIVAELALVIWLRRQLKPAWRFHRAYKALSRIHRTALDHAFYAFAKAVPGALLEMGHWKPNHMEDLAQRLKRRRLGGVFHVGITVVRTSDEDREDVVRCLVQNCDMVCIDISSPSRHIEMEIRMMAEFKRGDEIIWMRQSGIISPLQGRSDETFSIFGKDFAGPYTEPDPIRSLSILRTPTVQCMVQVSRFSCTSID